MEWPGEGRNVSLLLTAWEESIDFQDRSRSACVRVLIFSCVKEGEGSGCWWPGAGDCRAGQGWRAGPLDLGGKLRTIQRSWGAHV